VWKEDEGVLTFEWILLITVLAIGIVGGLSAVRDALISELGDLSFAITALDQSYTIVNPMEVWVHTEDTDGASDSIFQDQYEYVETCRPAQPPVDQDNLSMEEPADNGTAG
jgi:hypothetical protein